MNIFFHARFFFVVIILITFFSSLMTTPIPSSISSTPSISSVEPFSALLSKPVDWDVKIQRTFEIVLSPSRIVAADSDSLVEQIPTLIQLIGEVSKSDMKDPHQVSPWLLEESVEKMLAIFDCIHRKNFLFFLTRISSMFVFPLAALPAQVYSVIQSERELVLYNFLSSSGYTFLNLNKSLNLHGLDYYFFAFAMLPLVDLSTAVPATASYAPKTTTTSSWWSPSTANSKWHDESKSGSVYEKLLLNYCQVAIQGSLVTSPIDPQVVQGCQLAIGTWIDFHLNPTLYSGTNLNFGKIFNLTSKMCKIAILAQRTRGLGPVLLNRVARLLTTLLSGGKGSRFIFRLDISNLASLINLWFIISAPWKILGTPVDKEFVASNSDLYSIIVPMLQSIPFHDFVADFYHAKFSGKSEFEKFISRPETRVGIDALVKIFEVIGPARDGSVIDVLPASSGIVKNGDATTAFRQVVQEMWQMARQCTWHDGYVPKQLSEESWRMDALVKAAKGTKKGFLTIFSWEEEGGKTDVVDIPRKKIQVTRRIERRKSVSVEQTWNSAICSNEVGWVVMLLKQLAEKQSGIDLGMNPEKFSYMRKFANVTILLLLSFFSWMYISISWCPWLESKTTIFVVQIFFVVIVGLLSLKLIGSQYIV